LPNSFIKQSMFIMSGAILMACGGDGGGSTTPAPPPGGGGSVNQPPSVIGATDFTFSEDQRVLFTLDFSDPENDTLTITIEAGGDGHLFTIDETSGEIFATDNFFNFEQPRDGNQDNIYEQSISISDGTNTVSENITVAITNVVEPPQYNGDNDFQIDENSSTGFSIQATDPDGRELTFALAGEDVENFSISNGFLNFEFAPDFESPSDTNADNIYLIDVDITNEEATITQSLSIEILNVNEPPVCSTDVTVTAAENTSGEVFVFETSDPENDPHSFAATLDITADPILQDSLAFDSATGTVSLQSPVDFEALANPVAEILTTFGPTTCSLTLETTDIDGIPTSGLVFKGGVDAAYEIHDIEGDGYNELWLRGDSTETSGGFLFSGTTISSGFPAAVFQAADGLQIKHSDNEIQGHIGTTYFNARAMGDIDGDGLRELLLWEDTSEGWPDGTAAYLIWGTSLQDRTAPIVVDEMSASTGLELQFGDFHGSFTGSRVGLTTGDFDGDSIDDIAIGLPDLLYEEVDDGTGFFMETYGFVLVIFGETLASAKSNGILNVNPFSSDGIVNLNLDRTYFETPGEHLETLSDVDGDGADELLMSWENGVGVAFGKDIETAKGGSNASAIISNEYQTNRRTTAFNHREFDADGDGLNDFIFTPEFASELAVIGSGDIEPVGARSGIQLTSNEHSVSTNGVSGMNDINGDGLDDFVVGFTNSLASSPGNRVSLFAAHSLPAFVNNADIQYSVDALGAGDRLDLFSPVSNKTLNAQLTGIADLDGDSLDELVIVSEDADETYVVIGKHLNDGLNSGQTLLELESLLKNEVAAAEN